VIFYHGTTEVQWAEIETEGILWGRRGPYSRCTYLTTSKQEAMCHGDVLLEVVYEPGQTDEKDIPWDNYVEGCWQFRVYKPIPIQDVRRIQ